MSGTLCTGISGTVFGPEYPIMLTTSSSEVDKGSTKTKLKLRKIKYYDREHRRTFEFISNLFEFRADTIAALYKIRWQIELLFKQIKQNFSVKIFFRR